MEVSTLLTIVSLIKAVAGGVDKVIKGFDRLQNAPRELREFKNSIRRLERNFADFQNDVKTTVGILHADDVEQIEETLTLCASLFHKTEERQVGEGVVHAVLRSIWSSSDNDKLAKYKARIDELYWTILLPGSIQLLKLQANSAIGRTSQEAVTDAIAAFDLALGKSQPASVVSEGQLQPKADFVKDPKATQSPDLVEQKLRQLDAEKQRFRVQLGLQDQGNAILDEFQDPGLFDMRRPSTTLVHEEAPTTLYLHNAPEKHQKLELERVRILAHDNDTRILQYKNRDGSINVTHIVPYGSIPWTSERESRRVSFLTAHVITVSDKEGYHNYHIDPKYKFANLDACWKFQSTLRERDLCGSFDAIEISEASTTVARRQVIRLWQRKRQNELTIATMTFFTSSTESKKHREISLAEYSVTTKFHTPVFKRHIESDTVEMIPSVSARRGTRVIRVKFESVNVAQFFSQQFKAVHPNNVVPALVLPAQTPMTRTSTGQSGSFSIPTSVQSGPPSLYPASSVSVTTRSTPAPTPSDTTWNPPAPQSDQKTWNLDGDFDE